MKHNIAVIINGRVSLQNVQSILNKEFGIREPNFQSITKLNFLQQFRNWDEEKKHKFLVTIGGPMNYETTKKYLHSVYINKLTNQ